MRDVPRPGSASRGDGPEHQRHQHGELHELPRILQSEHGLSDVPRVAAKLDSNAIVLTGVLHFIQMSNTITVRLPGDLAEWLEQTARKTGLPRGRIIREELERARGSETRPFLRLAGRVAGPKDLSSRKGFSKK